ncbi:MAG: ATP-binding cassette domain-containing protein, partial [Agromyces sp.]
MPDLVFDDVSITYRTAASRGRGDIAAVRNVSLSLPAGGTLGIAGESGSGKSTLGQLVSGLLAPDRGRVVVDGLELAGARRVDLRA